MITNALWFVPNAVILRALQTPTVKEEIRHFSSRYGARLIAHPNDLAVNLMVSNRPQQATTKAFATRSACQILSVIIVIIYFSIKIYLVSSLPKVTTGLEPNSYRGALLNTPLFATVQIL
jgi:hypothetical protein